MNVKIHIEYVITACARAHARVCVCVVCDCEGVGCVRVCVLASLRAVNVFYIHNYTLLYAAL